jgi:type IV pilus assembly protein PilA
MLARLRKRNDENDEGFTLIELLVVIIIIGILAAIAIPVFLSQKSKGYEASMKSDLRTAAQEVESSNVDNQNYAAVPFATAVSVPGTSKVVAGTPGLIGANPTVSLSTGNSILLVGALGNAFCLKATSTKTAAIWWYSSDNGGLLKDAATPPCSITAP